MFQPTDNDDNFKFEPVIRQISDDLKDYSLAHKIDKSAGSIGKRYARTDEIAIPFGVTIDFHTLKCSPPTVTLRDRDSLAQIRVEVADLGMVINQMSTGRKTWDEMAKKYPTNDKWMSENFLEDHPEYNRQGLV